MIKSYESIAIVEGRIFSWRIPTCSLTRNQWINTSSSYWRDEVVEFSQFRAIESYENLRPLRLFEPWLLVQNKLQRSKTISFERFHSREKKYPIKVLPFRDARANFIKVLGLIEPPSNNLCCLIKAAVNCASRDAEWKFLFDFIQVRIVVQTPCIY